jgi:hypothetical protein
MRDISDKADNVGDTLKAEVFNVNKNELQHVVETGGVGIGLDPEGGPDSDEYMLSKSIASYSGGGEYYECSGISPLYQLSRSTFKFTNNYFTGLQILFISTFVNTAAPQVQIGTLGVVDLKQPDGSVIPDNYIQIGSIIEALYVTDHFKMINFVPIRTVNTPRMDFIYTEPYGTNGVKYSVSSRKLIPITETFNSIPGATFGTNVFTLPKGYIYDVDITQAYDEEGGPNHTRVFLAATSDTATPLIIDIGDANQENHTTRIHGLLDLKAAVTDQEIGLYIYTTGSHADTVAGKAVSFRIIPENFKELYTRGTILQTGY